MSFYSLINVKSPCVYIDIDKSIILHSWNHKCNHSFIVSRRETEYMCVNEKETGVIAKVDDHSHQQTVHMRGKKERASRVEQVEMNIRVIYDSEMWNVLET